MPTPPFNWIPPEWNGAGKPDLSKDPNFQAAPPVFHDPDKPLSPGGNPKLNGGIDIDDNPGKPKKRLTTLKDKTNTSKNHFVASRALELTANSEGGANLTEVPHPESDFRHIDPGFDGAPFLAAIDALKGLKGPASKDGEVDNAFKKALPPMLELENLLAPNPLGMQRLRLSYHNILVKIIVLFGEMNVALKNANANQGRDDYIKAREEYIELLKDLDDREPDTTSPGKKGYGRCIQWVYIRPIIHTEDPKDPAKPAQIKGAVVQAKWNPHLSSSGVPIPH